MTTQHDEAVELLPCPFCGSSDVNIDNAAYCPACGASGPQQDDDTDHPLNAIRRWNTRAALSATAEPAGEVERLREALKNIQYEAERQNGGLVHLKRAIANNCRAALSNDTETR